MAAVRGADKTRCSHLSQDYLIVLVKNSIAGQLGFSLSDASPVEMRCLPSISVLTLRGRKLVMHHHEVPSGVLLHQAGYAHKRS